MRPKPPKKGKRILLEKITFIWSRMNFTSKVTARNLFRNKRRFFTTLIGVAGCTALLLTGAFTLGYAILALTVARAAKPNFVQLFDGFRNYASSLALYLLIAIFTFLWALLFLIPGIIKSYSYSMSYYILADDPDIPANEARKRSMELMRGNKWRLFCLDFSFIGWILLSILTLGILFFWILPYIQTAHAEFYQDLLAREYAARQAAAPQQGEQAPLPAENAEGGENA